MEQEYQIEWIENKEAGSYGKLCELTLKDSKGANLEKIAAWPKDWPMMNEWKPGTKVTGSLFTKTNAKGYTNTTIYPPKEKKGGFGGVKAAQERKAEMIEKAQDRKNESIAYFNSLNTAIAYWAAKNQGFGLDDVFKTQEELLARWQKYESGDYQSKHAPF